MRRPFKAGRNDCQDVQRSLPQPRRPDAHNIATELDVETAAEHGDHRSAVVRVQDRPCELAERDDREGLFVLDRNFRFEQYAHR